MWEIEDVVISMNGMVNRNDWVATIPMIINAAIEEYKLETVEQMKGGKLGIVILCKKNNQYVVLKIIHPREAAGQIAALQSLEGPFPKIIDSNAATGTILLEYLEGEPWDMEKPIDIGAAAAIMEIVHSTPLENYYAKAPAFLDECLTPADNASSQLLDYIDKARQLAKQAPEADTHIHGDLGAHNFFLSNGQLIVLDPSGFSGAAEFDVGSFITRSGRSKDQTLKMIPIFTDLLNLDEREVARWTIYRMTLSGNRKLRRGFVEDYQAYMDVLPKLYNHYQFEF